MACSLVNTQTHTHTDRQTEKAKNIPAKSCNPAILDCSKLIILAVKKSKKEKQMVDRISFMYHFSSNFFFEKSRIPVKTKFWIFFGRYDVKLGN